MKKSYIFIFNESLGSDQKVYDYVNDSQLIITWRKELNNAFFIISRNSAQEIYEEVSRYFGQGKGTFLISEVSSNKQGLLNKRSWSLLNDKKLPPKEG